MQDPDSSTIDSADRSAPRPDVVPVGRELRSLTVADFVPRLLAFYHDVVDEQAGATIGWRTVAWGLALADGSALTVPTSGPTAITVWPSLEDAAQALDAYVDTPDPGRRINDYGDPANTRASRTRPPRPSDDADADALPVLPGRPRLPRAGEGGQDGSVGTSDKAEVPPPGTDGSVS